MKQGTILIGVIVVLIILNFAALLFILKRDERPGKGNPKFDEMVIERLHLDKAQVAKFDVIKFEHHDQMVAIEHAMRKPFEAYFMLLSEENPDTAVKDSLEKVLLQLHKDKITATYDHFKNLKAICRPEQRKDFELLVPHFLRVMTPHKSPGR